MNNLENELRNLINRYSQENGSNTPDFILRDYLFGCLQVFNQTINRRDEWYGRKPKEVSSLTLNPDEYFSPEEEE